VAWYKKKVREKRGNNPQPEEYPMVFGPEDPIVDDVIDSNPSIDDGLNGDFEDLIDGEIDHDDDENVVTYDDDDDD
jgi:hypothetical protein